MVENREAAFTSRKVATIVRDLDFELDLEGASFPSFSPEAVTKTSRSTASMRILRAC